MRFFINGKRSHNHSNHQNGRQWKQNHSAFHPGADGTPSDLWMS
jgi:hypothetical protein